MGAWVIKPDAVVDERGFFARIWCAKELEAKGLETSILQSSIAFNHFKGTLRGLHWQGGRNAEVKLVRVTRGTVWDVIVDLREDSPTYLQHEGFTLSDGNHATLYVPRGFAHGYVTLEDNTELTYQMSACHDLKSGRGARYNDPAFGIHWPVEIAQINERDRSYPDFHS